MAGLLIITNKDDSGMGLEHCCPSCSVEISKRGLELHRKGGLSRFQVGDVAAREGDRVV